MRRRNAAPHLDVLLQLDFMLPRQLLMLPLKLGDQQLPLELLLVLESHQLLLQLLLRVACWKNGVRDFLSRERFQKERDRERKKKSSFFLQKVRHTYR